jgi:dienelactone hydrolase
MKGGGLLLAGWLCCGAVLAQAKDWTVQTLSSRTSNGQRATVAIATYKAPSAADPGSAPPVRHVLVYPRLAGEPLFKMESGETDLPLGGPWIRSVAHLQAQGISMIFVDAPSDAAGRSMTERPLREIKQDLAAVAKEARQRFPGAQVHLLDVAGDIEGFDKIVLAASALSDNRTSDWSSLRKPVLMLHAPSAQCDVTPFLEAQMIAKRSRFTFVQVGYRRQEEKDDCGRNGQFVLAGREALVAKTVAAWLDGKEVAPIVGQANPPIAWREEIVSYQAPGAFGSNRLEATLLLPEAHRFGAGPYPVLVWNHGDVGLDHPAIRYKSRIRELGLAREFLNLGVAVLMPARRGVGMSEGTYPRGFRTADADPVYLARVHAEDIVPALVWLKTRPELDANRVIQAGQSAGGYTAMYLASQNLPGLIGAIDFAGGRTNMSEVYSPNYVNRMMVDGFAELGKTTRIPTLWVFAENDSRYTAETIRASFEAFQAAGGKGRLLLSPPIEGDGHFIYGPVFGGRRSRSIWVRLERCCVAINALKQPGEPTSLFSELHSDQGRKTQHDYVI